MGICKHNIAVLAVFGSTFRNETMLFSIIKIQNIMYLNRYKDACVNVKSCH